MNTRFYAVCLTGLFFILTVSAGAQQNAGALPEKVVLINEIREITGLSKYVVKPKIESKDLSGALNLLVDKDTTLTDDQKAAIRPLVAEVKDRIEKEIRAYVEDGTVSNKIFEQVSINHFDNAFDETELKEILTFIRTPTGRKAFGFMKDITSRTMKAFSDTYSKAIGLFIQTKLDEGARQIRDGIRELKEKRPEA